VNDDLSATAEVPSAALTTVVAAPRGDGAWRWTAITTAVVALVAIAALAFAWRADQRVRDTERELVRRQQESADRIAEAAMLSRQAQDATRDALAKVALLEARLNEIAVQRDQLEDLIQSVARSRDENLVADIESALRAAMQQAALTGSAEPLVATLKQSDDRLARANQVRLEPVRRAVARDLVRIKAASVADVASLSVKVDEVVRMVDELPLLAAAEPRRDLSGDAGSPGNGAKVPPVAPGDAAASSADGVEEWIARGWNRAGHFAADNIWTEIRSLVRITRIEQPEAMLVAPDQAFFLRENLKLRLLSARLALLARQFDAAQGDLRWCDGAVMRYFDHNSKRTQIADEQLRQVIQQSHQAGVARPDDTLAALAAASAAR
jgi:uroporphyrin-III C-methyltransferase